MDTRSEEIWNRDESNQETAMQNYIDRWVDGYLKEEIGFYYISFQIYHTEMTHFLNFEGNNLKEPKISLNTLYE